MTQEKLINTVDNDNDFWENLTLQENKRKQKTKFQYPNTPEFHFMLSVMGKLNVDYPKVNEIVSTNYLGTQGDQHVFSAKGFKDQIYVDNRPIENKFLKNTQIGDKVDLLILDVNEDNFFIKGSLSAIYETRAHESLKSLDENLVVTALIRSLNPAGYDVDIYHDGITLPGFMPNTLAGINKLHDPNSIVGEELQVMLENYSKEVGTYIVSRRKYLKTLITESVKELESGVIYEGHVTGTTPFGVFVEFNDCLTGMIHKANITPDWADRISDIKPGMGINFYVKEVTKDRNGEAKIILTQVIRESLWDTIKIGQSIDGRVKESKPFGTLVYLDDETMGLIHSSEMEKLGRKFTPDQEIKVKVLAVDRSNRKIFLTLEV